MADNYDYDSWDERWVSSRDITTNGITFDISFSTGMSAKTRSLKMFVGTNKSAAGNAYFTDTSITSGKVIPYGTIRAGVKGISWPITGLSSGTKYYYQLQLKADNEDIVYCYPSNGGGTNSFTTTSASTVTYYLYFDKNATDATAGTGYKSKPGTTSATFTGALASVLPTRPGYDFVGWAKSASASSADYSNSDSVTLTYPNTELTLYAVWKEKSYTKHSATGWDYDVKDETTTSFKVVISGISSSYDREFRGYLTTSPTTSVPSAWALSYKKSQNASGNVDVEMEFTGLSPGTTYYWHIQGRVNTSYDCYCLPSKDSWGNATTLSQYTYKITFHANGGTGAGKPRISTPTTSPSYEWLALTSSEEPTMEGYVFLGWDTSSAGKTVVYKTGEKITAYWWDPEIDLYAVWGQYVTYYLWLDGNEGTLQGNTGYSKPSYTGSATFGPPITEKEPIRTNYKFLGWSKDASDTQAKYVNSGTITLYSDEPNVTLYAIWKPPTIYQIIFHANDDIEGPEGKVGRTANSPDEDYTFSALQSSEAPTRNGYDFLGWSVVPDADRPTYEIGETVTVYETEPTIHLYAIWKEIEYPNDEATLTIESPTPILLTLKLSNITARNYDRTIKVSCGSSLDTATIKAGAVSFQRTFTDLTAGTAYATSVYIYAPDERVTWKETRTGYTQFGFDWSKPIAKDQPVSNLTWTDWNKYMELLATKAKRHDATSPKYTTAKANDPITATICNQPTLALYYIYGYYPVGSVSKGQPISASFFNNLKTYLNKDDN